MSLYTDLIAQAWGQKFGILKPITKPVSFIMHKITNVLEPAATVKEMPKDNIRWFKGKQRDKLTGRSEKDRAQPESAEI
jgi:hypothetical protein